MIGLLLLFFVLVPASAASGAGPYGAALSWTGDGETTMSAVWRDSIEQAEVMQVVLETDYDTTGFSTAVQYSAACKDISLDGSGAWHYEATAKGLHAGTVYLYRVGREGRWSDIRRFTTLTEGAEDLSFVYMGDIQPLRDSATEFARWGQLTQVAYAKNPELAFGILGGDIVDSGISLEQFDLFREHGEGVFSQIPLLATNGNHESNFVDTGKPELYLDVFALPENGPEGFSEEFYSFNAANCHVLVLNSWIFSGEQKLTETELQQVNHWISADLQADESDWQVVVTHVPVYAVHSDTVSAAVKENWAPIFEEYGVDLVFEGHQHVYSRSYPLYQGRVDYERGIPYIMGVSGSKFYDSADESFAEQTIYGTSNYQLVQISGSSMTVQTLDEAGNELDFTTIRQRTKQPTALDVEAGSWYEEPVQDVLGRGLMELDGAQAFRPNAAMTRQAMAEALYRLAGSPAVADAAPFSDCDVPSVAWAYGAGVFKGKGNGSFDPNGAITRQELAALFYRYATSVAGLNGTAAERLSAFSDQSAVSDWARTELNWAVDFGLIRGMGDGRLAPGGGATRAQAAAMMMRFAKGGSL